jgi:hypothetical protein
VQGKGWDGIFFREGVVIVCVTHYGYKAAPFNRDDTDIIKGVPSAVGFPHCAGSGEGYL